ncbi:LRR receptor-like serine/threonine-protein kinase EFR [Vigna unguiculata]|uniref:non-specific serine/threonine protein kinase n=1 Tax=Vigna unguiculata TaxID=3917 RepID=A0A4D6LSI3_VIGUN|nr:LRR receptor-like serine/threonine-protein kinase EFR [Vigna unguiculata]
MKYFSLMLLAFWSKYVHLLVLFTLNSPWFIPKPVASASENETDLMALLEFRKSIFSDPHGIFLSWNTSTHFCNWHGIICNPMQQRVSELNLQGYKLKGFISPYIGNLSYMRNINLGDNNFYGKIPQEFGRLSQLHNLSVANNSLGGEIPTNLTGCTNLKLLHLGGNNFSDKIPIEIGSLRKLEQLFLLNNQFTGEIPSFMGNLSSLTLLSVGKNNLEGSIPQEICHLKNLTGIAFHVNKLTGTFPTCLYNMSSLTIVSATNNQLEGSLPTNMFHTLPNLHKLLISGNQITGSIPPSITNASFLSYLDADHNYLTGLVPSLSRLQGLQFLSLSENNLGDNSTDDLVFLTSLTNCSQMQVINIGFNNFGGHLPNSLGNLSMQLNRLYVGGNHISGEIPSSIGNLIGLVLLSMTDNLIDGIIPATFGKLQNMQKLRLGRNKLSGGIGAFIGNLSQLFHLDVGENMLEGKVPPSIGNCQRLQHLVLSRNNFTGTIPFELFTISSLTTSLDLSQNLLNGSIPVQVGNLKNLDSLDLSENNLSDHIPLSIGECITLEYLNLKGNSLQGMIPPSLASLKGLQSLDLSQNSLGGTIPNDLQKISVLQYFNVSLNKLVGEVPKGGVFQNASALVVTGNSNLCGGISELHLPPCPIHGKILAKLHPFMLVATIVSTITFLLIMSIILTIYRMRSKKPSLDSPAVYQMPKASYQSLHNATNGFSITNLVGSGSFSFVYKGILRSEEKVVAIKVLNLQKRGSQKSFIAECNALKHIKHRNVVPILTCCSGIDYKGEEFKALIFEYMKNGSLEQWLHPSALNAENSRTYTLNLDQRLNIMIDVASALYYLHYECEQLIIHCDLKPSNVLLDDDMIAHVSDFGIARVFSTINGTSWQQTSTIGIKGTIGYTPPEYGMGSAVSTAGDMYSFGILILEMLTGRRPTDEIFEDGQNLHTFVESSFPDNLLQVLDPSIVVNQEQEHKSQNLTPTVEKCVVSLFEIGLVCSMESPKERMNMVDVTRELSEIRKTFSCNVK